MTKSEKKRQVNKLFYEWFESVYGNKYEIDYNSGEGGRLDIIEFNKYPLSQSNGFVGQYHQGQQRFEVYDNHYTKLESDINYHINLLKAKMDLND